MAGHEWDDWFEREELIGQISDIRVQNLQGKSAGGMGWVKEYDHEDTNIGIEVTGVDPMSPFTSRWEKEIHLHVTNIDITALRFSVPLWQANLTCIP